MNFIILIETCFIFEKLAEYNVYAKENKSKNLPIYNDWIYYLIFSSKKINLPFQCPLKECQ